jgi:hypothetical protein
MEMNMYYILLYTAICFLLCKSDDIIAANQELQKWESDILYLINQYKNSYLNLHRIIYADSPKYPERIIYTNVKIEIFLEFPRAAYKTRGELNRFYEGKKVRHEFDEERYIYEKDTFTLVRDEKTKECSRLVNHINFGLINILNKYGWLFGTPTLMYPNIISLEEIINSRKYSILTGDNKDEFVLYLENSYGKYSYHIYHDKDFNKYLLKKIIAIRNRNHWYEPNKPLYLMTVSPDDPERPQSSFESQYELIEYDRYKQIDNKIVFTYVKHRQEEIFGNGQKVVHDGIWDIYNINFDYDKSKLNIPPEVKNGTPVTVVNYDSTTLNMQTQEGIEYEWRDGQVVKRVPHSALGKLTDVEFHGSSLWSRGLIVVIVCIALIATTTAILYYRQRRRTKPS